MWNEDSDIFYAAISGWPHGRINQFLQSVEVIDDHTVKMVNSTPFVHFLELMTGYMFPAMVSTTQVEKLGNEEFANDPVATGPFQWNHEVKDVRTVMDRNEDYWDAAAGKGPFLDQIVWVPREEVAARVDVAADRRDRPDLRTAAGPDPSAAGSGLQDLDGKASARLVHVDEPGEPHKPRCAGAASAQHGARQAGDGNGPVAGHRDSGVFGMSAPGAPSHAPDFKMFDYDPAEAKKLLSAAGHDSFQQTWWFPTAGSGNILPVQMAQWMQANFAEVGFDHGDRNAGVECLRGRDGLALE